MTIRSDTITRTETVENGKESEALIPFMKGCTVSGAWSSS